MLKDDVVYTKLDAAKRRFDSCLYYMAQALRLPVFLRSGSKCILKKLEGARPSPNQGGFLRSNAIKHSLLAPACWCLLNALLRRRLGGGQFLELFLCRAFIRTVHGSGFG
jgi:hypothetical protein